MKTSLALLGFLFLIPNISFAAVFDRNLYYGTTGSDVSALQEFLTDQGVYTGPISGNFYSLTLSAVKRFQAANNISPVSGYFGVLSRGVANTLLEPVAPIEETGMTTAPVIAPQPVAQVQPPTFGSVSPINTPAPQQIVTPISTPAPVIASCDSTPVLSISFDQQSVNPQQNPNLYVNATTNVVDGCGKTYPYNVYAGNQPRKTGMNTKGVQTIAITGSNISFWEITGNSDVAAGTHAPNYPYPVSVITDTASTTAYLQVL